MSLDRLAIIALMAMLAGCSTSKPALLTPPQTPIVWPKQPDAPRIRYLGELTGSREFQPSKSMSQFWDEIVHGPPRPISLVSPHAVAVHKDGNRVAVADTNVACVHLFDLERHSYEQKNRCGSPVQLFESPVAVMWVGDELWVADSRVHAVAVFEPNKKERWFGRDELKRPTGLAFCQQNGLCYVIDAAVHGVLAFDRQGQLVLRFGTHGGATGQFNCPSQIVCSTEGVLVVADALNFRIQRFGLDGTPLDTFGGKGDAPGDLALPKGVAVGPDGNLWVVDGHFENIQTFTPQGKLLMVFGQEGHGPGEFWLPAGICIDEKRRMWVADTYNRRVQVFELLE